MLVKALLIAGLLLSNPLAAADNPAVIPKPVKMQLEEKGFELDDKTVVVAGGESEPQARLLAEALRKATGFGFPISISSATPSITLQLDKSLTSPLGEEGYLLSVTSDGVLIRAAGSAGLFYGGVTLRQLLPPEICSTQPATGAMRWQVPAVVIEDYPRFAWRGLLLDVARHFKPPEFLKKLTDLLAMHKMNVLQLHLTDDQGWRLEIKKYPRLAEIGSVRKESPKHCNTIQGDGVRYGPFFYTQEEMRDIVAYAQARNVTIVPEIDMPGHSTAALASYPELSCTGGPFEVMTHWGVFKDIICPGNDRSLEFVRDVLSEVVDIFPSEFIHIGGDEAPKDRWNKCDKCQARIKAERLTNEEALQGWFNRRLDEFLAGKGRRLIGWDEILAGGLPPRATVMSWRGTEGGITAAEGGHDVIMSPTSHCYFDYAQGRGPHEPASFGDVVPLNVVYAFDPMPPQLAAEKRKHLLGAQGNVWGECIRTAEDVEYFAFPRAAALAEVTWSPAGSREFNEFRNRLEHHLKRLDQLKVNYRKLDPK